MVYPALSDSALVSFSSNLACGARLDLGVDPNKSTPVDLGIPSRVESFLPSATDPQVEFVQKSDLKLFSPQVDLNRLETKINLNLSYHTNDREVTAAFKQIFSAFAKINEAYMF